MLSGSLRDSTGLPLAGRTVTLHRAVWPATIQTPNAVVITNANGNYSTVVRPTKATTYSASFVGARGLTGRISTPAHVVVVPKVTLRLNDSTARLGQKVVFSGGVSPGAQGRTVYLQRAIKGRWTHASTATVTSRGTFAFAWKPTSTVDYTFRVVLPAGNGWSMGTSNTRRLVVS
jgi:hypothetical protein